MHSQAEATFEPDIHHGQPEGSASRTKKDRKRNTSPSAYSKPCHLCRVPSDVLVRCQIDSSLQWYFVCTKQCWKDVSGGVVEGDAAHLFYKYGGMWKNKHAGVSAKKPKVKKTGK